ncbi:MAG: hypothetical protein SF172_17955 [Burkholderiales bacterium]|nr:hypothetical protein [Burkholderiales bacterium]
MSTKDHLLYPPEYEHHMRLYDEAARCRNYEAQWLKAEKRQYDERRVLLAIVMQHYPGLPEQALERLAGEAQRRLLARLRNNLVYGLNKHHRSQALLYGLRAAEAMLNERGIPVNARRLLTVIANEVEELLDFECFGDGPKVPLLVVLQPAGPYAPGWPGGFFPSRRTEFTLQLLEETKRKRAAKKQAQRRTGAERPRLPGQSK